MIIAPFTVTVPEALNSALAVPSAFSAIFALLFTFNPSMDTSCLLAMEAFPEASNLISPLAVILTSYPLSSTMPSLLSFTLFLF